MSAPPPPPPPLPPPPPVAQAKPADYPGCPVTVLEAEARGEQLRAPRWGIGSALITVFGALFLGLLVAAPLLILGAPLAITAIVGTLVPWISLAGWPLFVTWWKGNGPRIDLGLRLTWSDVGWGALAGFVGLMMAGIIALITQAIAGDFSSAAGDVALDLQQSGPFWALAIFAVMIMVGAPIVEEIAFRGMLFNSLRKKGVGAIWTIIITAVVFSAFHFEPIRFFLLLPIGLVYGWVRWKTGSLGAAMVAHGVNNAPAALVVLIGVPEVTT
jgi:membrane protease YdiL (CAAX protease family)